MAISGWSKHFDNIMIQFRAGMHIQENNEIQNYCGGDSGDSVERTYTTIMEASLDVREDTARNGDL